VGSFFEVELTGSAEQVNTRASRVARCLFGEVGFGEVGTLTPGAGALVLAGAGAAPQPHGGGTMRNFGARCALGQDVSGAADQQSLPRSLGARVCGGSYSQRAPAGRRRFRPPATHGRAYAIG
jgi:hypothetical protein